MNAIDTHADLVFEGGGVKGIGLAGALATLEEREYRPQNIAGTSAGAITAALLAAGYSADELREIIVSLDYRQFQDRAWEDKVPLVERSLSLLLDLGLFEGDRFLSWIRERLAAKGVHTFADLVQEEFADDPRYRSRLQVIASDVTTHELLVLPRDAKKLGIEPDELDVALAVRMSMSIPIFFEPVRFENPNTGQVHVIVDGGMLSNFPVWLFDCDDGDVPEWPTFGLLLVEPKPEIPIGARLPKPKMTGQGPRRGDRLRQGARADDDGGARPALRRAVELRPHDPDPDARRRHDRVRPEQGARARPLRLRPLGGGEVPRQLGLRGLHRRVPVGKKHSRREALVASMG